MRGQAQTGQFSAPTVQIAQLATPPLQLQQPDAIEKPLSGELNSHLPSWLHFSGEIKLQCGILGDFFRNTDDSYLLTRLRLNMAIKPTSWLKFYLQGEDAHTIGASQTDLLLPLQQDTMDLRLAYVDLGDIEKKEFRVRLDRQDLAFGEERLIGPANWLNTPRSFDSFSSTLADQWTSTRCFCSFGGQNS